MSTAGGAPGAHPRWATPRSLPASPTLRWQGSAAIARFAGTTTGSSGPCAATATFQAVGRDPGTFCSGSGVLMADRGEEIAAQDSILYLDPPLHGPTASSSAGPSPPAA